MYGLNYSRRISHLRLCEQPRSKSTLQYLTGAGVTLPIRWRIGEGTTEWPRGKCCFKQLQPRTCGVESGSLTYWLKADKNTSAPDLSALLPAMIPHKLRRIQCWRCVRRKDRAACWLLLFYTLDETCKPARFDFILSYFFNLFSFNYKKISPFNCYSEEIFCFCIFSKLI